jgi:voltage-gated potassium channel
VNDGRYLIAIYLGSILIMGTMFNMLEATNWLDGYYWASTTMTTTGYGDISAHTDAGKIFTMIVQQWSIVCLALTISWVVGKANKDLYTHEEQVDDDMDRETIKAELLAIKEMLNERRA